MFMCVVGKVFFVVWEGTHVYVCGGKGFLRGMGGDTCVCVWWVKVFFVVVGGDTCVCVWWERLSTW